MAVIELLYHLEETFGVQIPNEDLAGLTTVGYVVSYVEKGLGESGSAAPIEKVAKSSEPKSKKKP
jgi:acyl carrier protein